MQVKPEVLARNDLNDPERKRILFVDDEQRVLDGLRRMLFAQRKEWDMVFAPGGKEALEALAAESFDVIVTDMRMPGMDGADLLNEVVNRFPQTVRLVLSGQWDQQIVVRAARTAHQYLMKPCSAETLKATLERIFALRRVLAGKSLKRTVAGLTALPSHPVTYRRLVDTLESPGVTAHDVAAVIGEDVALTAKILQLASSSFFGGSHQVSSIEEASLHLGVDTIKALAKTTGVFLEFDGESPVARPLEQLQRHCIATAHIAHAIAVMEGASKSVEDDAFLGCLLHDIGKLILMTKDPEVYGLIPALVKSGNLPVDAVERELFGANHGEVGAYLLWLWGLPPGAVDAVACHHCPAASSTTETLGKSLSAVTLVHAADALALEVEPYDGEGPQIDERYLAEIGLAGHLPAWRELASGAAAQSGGAA